MKKNKNSSQRPTKNFDYINICTRRRGEKRVGKEIEEAVAKTFPNLMKNNLCIYAAQWTSLVAQSVKSPPAMQET